MYFAWLICGSSESADGDGGGRALVPVCGEGCQYNGGAEVLFVDLVAGAHRIATEDSASRAIPSFPFISLAFRCKYELMHWSMRSLVRSSDNGGTKRPVVSTITVTGFNKPRTYFNAGKRICFT